MLLHGAQQQQERVKTMLNDLLTELTAMYIDRVLSTVSYSGYGTTIEQLIREYLDQGGSYKIIKQLDSMAYGRACTLMDEGYM